MEGHSTNFWNDIADQIQRSARALTQEETAARAPKINRKLKQIKQHLSKIGSESLLEALLGHSWPQEGPKNHKCSKTTTLVPPIWGPSWSRNPSKIDPEASQTQHFFPIIF